MLLGQLDDSKFTSDTVAVILYASFVFLVVILLANVLIAIVTDSYKVIQDQRAAIVFWTNRLNFNAQMDAIANGPWKAIFRKALGMDDPEKVLQNTGFTNWFGTEAWKRLMDIFEDEFDESLLSLDSILSSVLRVSAIPFIVPAWVILGLCTAGWLWPPQIREFVFTSTVSKHNAESEKEEELRRTQLVKVKGEIVTFGEEMRQEPALDRTQIVKMKSLVAERKLEIQSEMRDIKRLVAMFFEQVGGG